MKILTIADEICPAFWDYYVPGRLADFDLIISCGDLNPKYLSFIVTMARCPVLYVPGNHDTRYVKDPPEGCDSIDGRIVIYNGLKIMGLGGCKRYHPGPYQYTEKQMKWRLFRMRWPLKKVGGVDMLVTHAPPKDLGDAPDRAHWGFETFREFLDEYHPRYFLHGHVHMTYNAKQPRVREYGTTTLINAYERYVLEIPDLPHDPKVHNQLIWKTRERRTEAN